MEVKIATEAEAEEQWTSAEIVASIDDLLTKILLLLPTKSLLCFKSVSKHWLSLITNPRFCHLHSPKINPAIGLFLPSQEDNQRYDYIPLSVKNRKNKPTLSKLESFRDFAPFTILQSCNGLLLCYSTLLSDYSYYVYNPTSNQICLLPKPDGRNGICNGVYGMSLAFDPVKSYHYNVVCVCLLETNLFVVEIFCSETGSWRLCGEPFAALVNFETGVYCNGAIHWLGIGNGDSLYFDIEHQVLDKMPELPRQFRLNSKSNYYFAESCGHLHFVEMSDLTTNFDVYEMKRDYSKWFLKFRVDLSSVVRDNPDMVYGRVNPNNPMEWHISVFWVVNIIRGKKEEDSFLVLQTPKKVLRYDLVWGTTEILYEFKGNAAAKEFLRYPGICGFQFIESLCPV